MTRPKTNLTIDILASLPLSQKPGDGFVILRDEIGHHGAEGGRLDFPLRRLTLKIDGDRELTLITNDLDACALEACPRAGGDRPPL